MEWFLAEELLLAVVKKVDGSEMIPGGKWLLLLLYLNGCLSGIEWLLITEWCCWCFMVARAAKNAGCWCSNGR